MAKPSKTQIKTELEEYAVLSGKLKTLQAQRQAVVKPILETVEKRINKAAAEVDPQITEVEQKLSALRDSITGEFQKGFDAKANRYLTTSVESDSALIQVSTSETREISVAEWLKEVPKAEQEKTNFWDTLKVQIGKAEKFRSDLVTKLATKKVTHSVSIKLK